jgi:PAS domain S-box-containing protein
MIVQRMANQVPPLNDSEEKLKKNLVRQTILADIAQHFLSLDEFDKKISVTLSTIGKHTGVSRVYIFEDSADGTTTSNTYEWCNEGVSAQIDELQGIPYEIIPSWKKILIDQGRVFSTNIQELPEDILAILEPQGIKSILILPLYVENRFFGFVGFDECEREKIWEVDEVELLRTIAGIVSNSFERKLYQKKLSESELRLKLAIDNTETCLWDWNIQQDELFFNQVWYDMLGYHQDELAGDIKGWEDLIHPEDKDRVLDDLKTHIDGKTDHYVSTYRVKTRSGELKWVIDRGRVIERDNNDQPLRAIGTIIDIDRQKKNEEALRGLNSTKDKLFSIISHDLRGPIGAIMQIAEMVSEKNAVDEETLFMFLKSQKELTQHTFQLLDNLLSWSRFNLEQIQYKPGKISLRAIIDESLLAVRYRADEKGIPVNLEISGDIHAFADEEMIKIVVRNLLNNAIKFTRQGQITIAVNELHDHVTVQVTDTGVGIKNDMLEKILSDNEYITTRGTANEAGSGLGLKLCKNFILQNKGQFEIESDAGKGSVFSFTLPKMYS